MRQASTPLAALSAIAIFAVLGGVLSGCSSSGAKQPSTAASTDVSTPATAAASSGPVVSSASDVPAGAGACKYVSTEQAAALAKSPVKPGVSRSLPSGPVTFEYCDYIFDPGNAPAVTVAVADLHGNGSTLFAQLQASEQTQSDFQKVSGIGDEAFYADQNLNVRKGDTGLILYVGRSSSLPRGSDAIPDEKRLAELILGQL